MFFSHITIIYKGIKTNSTSINKLILETLFKLLGHFGEVEGTLKQDGVIAKITLPSAASSWLLHGFFLLYFLHLVLPSRNRPLSTYKNIYCSIPGTDSAH